MWILAAFDRAGLRGCVVGITYDPPNAAAVHAAGVGARIEAHFNTVETNASSKPFTAPATVRGLCDGRVTSRRGVFDGREMPLGPLAALDLGGMTAVVVSYRTERGDPALCEMFGLDSIAARSVVVKSRGHVRGRFEQVSGLQQRAKRRGRCAGAGQPVLKPFEVEVTAPSCSSAQAAWAAQTACCIPRRGRTPWCVRRLRLWRMRSGTPLSPEPHGSRSRPRR
jgi:hypothetical protein